MLGLWYYFIIHYLIYRENNPIAMATRIATRFVSRRFSSSGKVLSEEEKAAENIYIKVIEEAPYFIFERRGCYQGAEGIMYMFMLFLSLV